jgi:N-acetyl-gamma-glutamyl-phosphate reductase
MKNNTVSQKISIGIMGGAGYTGGELLRIASCHPLLEITFVHSRTYAGQSVWQVHADLMGLLPDLKFTNQVDKKVDVLFLCVGHGDAKATLQTHSFDEQTIIIDLSQDHRLDEDFIYGLAEVNRFQVKQTNKIANPGCFATAIQLPLFPFVASKSLADEVHITGITGSTGAGFKPTESTHFTWRSNNLSTYKAFEHQHLNEINHLFAKQGWSGEINFIPLRGNMTRGIIASLHFTSDLTEIEANEILQSYYQDSPFVHIVDQEPDVKCIVNTNNCLISVKKKGKYLHLVSVIDNLIKGAVGQAVQNLNIIKGFDETLGLKLKPVAF